MDLFKREPALVIGTVVSLLVCAYAVWRGLSIQEVLVQLAGLVAAFIYVRSRVTPYVQHEVDRIGRNVPTID
jgi:hypothetical protein